MSACVFVTYGIPQQQGSKNPWGGDANKNLKPWRGAVTSDAVAAFGEKPAILTPVKVTVVFVFPRPKSHYRTGKNAGVLRDDAPLYKGSTPDTDKLQRAIGDALTESAVIRDDSLISWWDSKKVYGDRPMACVNVEVL